MVVKNKLPYLCGVNNDKVKQQKTTKMKDFFAPQTILERQQVRLSSLFLELRDLHMELERATGNQTLIELIENDVEVVMVEIANLRVDIAELENEINEAH